MSELFSAGGAIIYRIGGNARSSWTRVD